MRSKTVPKDTTVFLCTKGGNTIDAENIRNLCRGMKTTTRITPHRFRHTAISNVALNHGITKAAILANHSSIETTHKYMVADLEIKRKVMEKAGIIDNSVQKFKPSNDLLEFLSKL